MKPYRLTAAGLAMVFASLVAQAQPAEGERHIPRAPRPEAVAACNGKQAGDTVTLTMRERTMEARCEKVGGQLAARPAERPDGPPREHP